MQENERIRARAHEIWLEDGMPDGKVPARSLSMVITREIDGGRHQDLDVRNHDAKRVRFSSEVSLRHDFADTFEVESNTIVRRGQIGAMWGPDTQALSKTDRNGDFARASG